MKDKTLNEIRNAAKKMFGKGDYVGATHYNRLPDHQQPAEVAHAWELDFLLWNTLKYLSRAGHKATATMSVKEKEIDDLSKAIDYIKMRINVLEGRTPLDFDEFSYDKPSKKDFYKTPITGVDDPWYYKNVIDTNERRARGKEELEAYYDKLFETENAEMRECYGDC
jgi:hypothetical protein